jgi:hypothetical protein
MSAAAVGNVREAPPESGGDKQSAWSAGNMRGLAVLHAGISLITVNPLRLDEAMKHIETEVHPRVQRLPGSLGLSLHVNSDLGLAVLETFWVSDDTLRAGERMIAPSKDEAVRRATGTITVEHFAVPVFEQDALAATGAGVRMTGIDVPPSRIEDAIEVFGDTTVPWLADTKGFCRTLYLVDRHSGRTVSETVWQDARALAGSRSAAAAIRAEVVSAAGGVIRAVQEYSMVVNTASKPS